jgi:hypothetical protein
MSLITPSPIFLNFGLLKGNIYFIIASLYFFLTQKIKLYKNDLYIISLILLFHSSAIIYWRELKLIYFPIYFWISWLIATNLNKKLLEDYIDFATKICMILLVGALLGFIYTFFGGQPIFSIKNEDTRLNEFFLTTFSNTHILNIIRPAGIYDEPGALSFIVCLVVAGRKFLNKSNKKSWILLILGFITLSLAHFVFVTLFLLQDMKKYNLKSVLLFLSASLALYGIIYFSFLKDVFDTFFFSRFKFENGEMAGDNRSALIKNAYNYLNFKTFLFGLDVDCIVRPESCLQKGYDQFGDNPLGPLIWGGITLTLPYYIISFMVFLKGVIKFNFVYIGIFLLLMQRIDVMSYGYALLIAIVLNIAFKSSKNYGSTFN